MTMIWLSTILFPSFTFFPFPVLVYLTIFFSCCKVHDFCMEALHKDAGKCNVTRKAFFTTKDFQYNKITNKCCEYKLDFNYFFACLNKAFVPFFFAWSFAISLISIILLHSVSIVSLAVFKVAVSLLSRVACTLFMRC